MGTISPSPDQILLVAVNWLGDLVLTLPALSAVRRRFPRASLSILVRRDLASFFDGALWPGEVIPFERGGRSMSLRLLLRTAALLRARRFDLAVLLPNNFESALLAALARIPCRAGFSRDGRGWLLTHRARATREVLELHQASYFLSMLEGTLGIPAEPVDGSLVASPERREAMRGWLQTQRRRPGGKLVALAAGASYGPAKQWPADHYSDLIDLLSEHYDAECVLVGAKEERALCERVAAGSRAGALVAAGETDIGEAMALLSVCDAFVGNDSGSMHLAGALGVPTVGLFGSTDPKRTGPLGPRARTIYRPLECSPCLARRCRFGHTRCLTQIRPEEVLDELQALAVFS